MAGQQEKSFRVTPAYEVPSMIATPTVTTRASEATASHVDETGRAQAFASLGNAFGNFFGGMQQTAQSLNQTLERERLTDIQKENEALAKQANVDQQTGAGMNPFYKDRNAYYGAFQDSAADQHASELGQGLQAKLRDIPKDGSVDPTQVAHDYFKEQFGQGTGDPEFDNGVLYRYSRTAQSLLAQTNEQVARTVETNTTKTILDDASTQINSQDGLTQAGFAKLDQRVLSVTRGDRAQADKMFGAMLSDPRNLTQSLNVLNVLDQSGWADRNPTEYTRISQQMVANLHRVKTVQADAEVQQWGMDVHMLSLNPMATVDDWAGLLSKAHTIDSNHGVGMEKFGAAFEGLERASKQQAGVNLFTQTVQGLGGSHDPAVVAQHYGKSTASVVDEHMDPAISQMVSGPNTTYPALRDSLGSNGGLVNPLESDQTMGEFSALITSPSIREASGGLMMPRVKTNMGNALTGTDPEQGARAFRGYSQILTRVGPHDFARYFPNDEAQAVFWGMKSIVPANGDVTQIFKDIRDNRLDSKLLAEAGDSGNVDLTKVFPDIKREDIDTKVNKAVNKSFIEDTGRGGFFSNPTAGMTSEDRAEFKGMVLYQALKLRSAGGLNFDTAVANASKVFEGTRLAIPGVNGGLRIIKDPWDGHGRSLGDPLNADPDSPISTLKGFAPIYSGFKMNNAINKTEDPIKTAKKDLDGLHESLPGIATDADQLSLGAPRSDGLMPIMNSALQPLQVQAGQPITVMTPSTVKVPPSVDEFGRVFDSGPPPNVQTASNVPEDPQEAQDFFKKNLPAGVYPVYNSATHSYTFHYGFRIETGKNEQAEILKKREAERSSPRGEYARSFSDQQKNAGLDRIGAFLP